MDRALALHYGNFVWPLALSKEVAHWSLTTLREMLVKIGAKVPRNSQHAVIFLPAVAVPRATLRETPRSIDGLRAPLFSPRRQPTRAYPGWPARKGFCSAHRSSSSLRETVTASGFWLPNERDLGIQLSYNG